MSRQSLSACLSGLLLLPLVARAQHQAVPCFDPDLGTNLNLGNDQTVAVNLPFTFLFPGAQTSVVSVCSNGFLWIGNNLAAPAAPNAFDFDAQPNRIAPLWADLDPSAPISLATGVWARLLPSRAVFTWNSVIVRHPGTTPSYTSAVTVQVQLLPDGTVIVHYGDGEEPWEPLLVGVHGLGSLPGMADLSGITAAPIDTGAQPNLFETFSGSTGFDLWHRTLLWSPNGNGGYVVGERGQCHSLWLADRTANSAASSISPAYFDTVKGAVVQAMVGQPTLVWNGSCFSSLPALHLEGRLSAPAWQACQDPSQPGAGLFLVGWQGYFGPFPTELYRLERSTWTRLSAPPVNPWTAGMATDTVQRVVVCLDTAGGRTLVHNGVGWSTVPTAHTPPTGRVSMAYDSSRQRMVMAYHGSGGGTWEYFGGDWHQAQPTCPPLHAIVFDQGRSRIVSHAPGVPTCEWNGTAWAQLGQPPTPVPGGLFVPCENLVYDEARRETLLIRTGMGWPAFERDVWAWNGQTWTQRFGTVPGPSARSEAVAAHDPGFAAVVLFGGQDAAGQALDQTWLWNGQSWRDRTGAVGSPGARSAAAMTWVPGARGRPPMTMLHGGRGPQGAALADTWALGASATWQPLSTGGRTPPARSEHAMVATTGGAVMLFGGRDGQNGLLGDTWKLDATTQWTNVSPVTAPRARDQHAMAWDPLRQRVVLFGGCGNVIGSALGDTWEFDPASDAWTEVTPASGSPASRWNHSLVYDPRRARTVLLGGGNANNGLLADVWEWDGVRWIARGFDSLPPGPAWQMAGTWNATNQTVFAFGGEASQGVPRDTTWEIHVYEDRVAFDAEPRRTLQVTGVPIAAPGFPTALQAGFPTPGGMGLVVLDFGPRPAPYFAIAPPLGCEPANLWPSPLWTGLCIGARASVNLPLPYFAELPSVTFWLQGLVVEAGCLRATEARAVLCRR